jgi:hypothetical protein
MTEALWLDLALVIAVLAGGWDMYRCAYRRGFSEGYGLVLDQLPMPVICRDCGAPNLWPAGIGWRQVYLGDDFAWGETRAARLNQVLVEARLEAVRLAPGAVIHDEATD